MWLLLQKNASSDGLSAFQSAQQAYVKKYG